MATYTKEQIAQMTGGEKMYAQQLFDAEEQLERSKLEPKVPELGPVSVETYPDVNVVRLDTPPDPLLNPPSAPPVETGTSTTLPPIPEEEVKDLNYWKKQAATERKRRSDQQPELTKLQQERAELKRENKELSSKIDSLTEKLNDLMDRVNKPAAHTPLEPDELSEFEDISKGVDKRLARMESNISRKLNERMQEIEKMKEELHKSKADPRFTNLEQIQHQMAVNAHLAEIASIHPDAREFLNENYDAMLHWATTTQPSFITNIVETPLSVSGKEFGHILTMFKKDLGIQRKTETPSLGDRVTRVNSNLPAPIAVEAGPGSLTDKEFDYLSDGNRITTEVIKLQNSGKFEEAEKLLTRYEKKYAQKYHK